MTAATNPEVSNPFYDEGKVKRAEAGRLGVRAAALLLDLEADLATDTASPGRPLDGLPSNTWTAPTGAMDDFPSNVRALAVDPQGNDHVRAYVGVPGVGIEILELTRVPASSNWNFSSVSERIETPGDPYGLTIRPADPVRGTPRSLLVSDAFGGLRIYGEEELP